MRQLIERDIDMKNVKFFGDLKNDIEMSNKKFNLIKTISSKIIGFVVASIFAVGVNFVILDFPIATLPMQIILTSGVYTILSVIQIKKEKAKFVSDKKKASEKLIGLVYSLQRVNVCTNLDQLQNSKVQENRTTSIIKENDTKVKTTEISRDIYFLDNLDNLQVLREKRSVIKANGYTKQDNSLKIIEEHEKPEYELNVEKVLVLKRKA